MATIETVRERTHVPSPPVSPPAPRSEVDERRNTAWIGHGVAIEGRVTSSQDLRIDGRVEGAIEVGNHALVVGPRAEVRADLAAKSVLIAGKVVGNVTAAVRVDVQAAGSVEGNITSPRLVMVDGAVVNGKVETGDNRPKKT